MDSRRIVVPKRTATTPASRRPPEVIDDVARSLDFVAIDFETADRSPDSACAVALVRVQAGRITDSVTKLIRPPRRDFEFTYIHHITWERVKDEPTFGQVWKDIRHLLEGARFLAAHNAPFDEGVLRACCNAHRLPMPDLPFECTVKLARKTWKLFPTKLNNVCDYLRIDLNHHEAGSDAEACAKIVIAALAPSHAKAGARSRAPRGT